MAGDATRSIFVTGASGLVGRLLTRGLVDAGHRVVALTRRIRADAREVGVEWVEGDVTREGEWMAAVAGCDAVVHLAGESVAAGRWTAASKARMRASRIDAAHHVVAAMRAASRPPEVLVSASGAGYYGARGDVLLDEAAAPGNDFLARLCVEWEDAAASARDAGARVVALRFGVVLSRGGGALARMWPLFRLGLGGPLGPRERYFPWIHEADAVGLIRAALVPGAVDWAGPVNAVAPEAVTMATFARTLAATVRRPALFPVPLWALDLALGEAASALVAGQRVDPARARALGYAFAFPSLAPALADLAGA